LPANRRMAIPPRLLNAPSIEAVSTSFWASLLSPKVPLIVWNALRMGAIRVGKARAVGWPFFGRRNGLARPAYVFSGVGEVFAEGLPRGAYSVLAVSPAVRAASSYRGAVSAQFSDFQD